MNFGELKTYVQDVLGRTDIPTAAYAAAQDDWNRKLRLQDDHVAATLASPYTLPATFLSLIEARIGDTRLRAATTFPGYTGTGKPQLFRVTGDKIALWPTTTESITIVYAAKQGALSNASDTNSVLTRFEQVAIYGALYHVCVMLRDNEGISAFGPIYANALDEARKEERRTRFDGGQMIPVPQDAA